MTLTPDQLLALSAAMPLRRRVFTPELLRGRTLCVCCESRDFDAARAFFRERFNLEVPRFGLVLWKERWQANPHLQYPGVDLIPLAELARAPQYLPVLFIDPPRERTIGRLFAEYGLHEFCFHADPAYAPTLARDDFFAEHAGALARVYALMEDEASRQTMLSLIRHRITRDAGYLAIAEYPEYRHPVVSAEAGDVVIDGGGFDGATSLDFAREVGPDGQVYCIEPDARNQARIRSNFELPAHQPDAARIQIIPVGLSDRPGQAELVGEGGSAKIRGSGGMSAGSDLVVDSVRLADLDLLVLEHNIRRVDLIKLDIEGMEMAALKGAVETLARFRPKLQISAYHKIPDIVEIPLWIEALGLGYRFYLGHHDTFITETDLYAMCPERMLVN